MRISRLIKKSAFAVLASMVILSMTGLSSCKSKDDGVDAGGLLLLWALTSNNSSNTYLLSIPNGVAK